MGIFKSNAYSITNDILIKIFKIFFVVYSMAIAIIAIDGMISSDSGTNKTAKYAIVYGSEFLADGNLSPRLEATLDSAYQLFENKKVEKIIVSGGISESGFDEAQVMRKYLLDKGMKIPWVLVDSDGYTIMETSKNAFSISRAKGNFPNVGVVGVSQFYSISRVKLSLKKAGFVYIGSASPDYYELRDIYSLVKEVPAYVQYIFMGVGENINVNSGDLKIIGEKVIKKLKNDSE